MRNITYPSYTHTSNHKSSSMMLIRSVQDTTPPARTEPGPRRRCRLGALAVSLADVAHPGGAMQVVEPSVEVKVSTVFIPVAKPVTGPAVRLTGFPASGNTEFSL